MLKFNPMIHVHNANSSFTYLDGDNQNYFPQQCNVVEINVDVAAASVMGLHNKPLIYVLARSISSLNMPYEDSAFGKLREKIAGNGAAVQ